MTLIPVDIMLLNRPSSGEAVQEVKGTRVYLGLNPILFLNFIEKSQILLLEG